MSVQQSDEANFISCMNWFFRTLRKTEEDVRQDLEIAKLNTCKGRICDFGCGDGFSTLCLVSLLRVTKALGIDKVESEIVLAKFWPEAINKFLELPESYNVEEENRNRARSLLNLYHLIDFRVGDVVLGEKMPENIDVAYCNLLLVNIYNSAFGNRISGLIGVETAIKNISKSINPGGYFLAIEQCGRGELDFRQLFEKADLVGEGECFLRKPITLEGRGIAEQRIRYVYQKRN